MRKILILVVGFCFIMGMGLAVANDEDLPGDESIETPEYTHCFTATGTDATIMLDYDGVFLTGVAESGTCGTGQILGDVAGSKFYIYRDWASGSGCVEGVWYTGTLGTLNYEWINTSGASGTGSMTRISCP